MDEPVKLVIDCSAGRTSEVPLDDDELAELEARVAAAPDIALTALREQRDNLLASSDWTQLPDAALSDDARAAWATYRQRLRDLPETTDPSDPSWPRPPRAGRRAS